MNTSSKISSRFAMPAMVLAISVSLSPQAMGAPTGAAHAYDLSVSINVVGVGVLNVPAQAEVQHAAQTAPFSDSDTVLSFDSGPGPLRLTTGELSAVSEWIPGTLFHAVGAQATVEDLNLTVLGLLNANLLSLSAQKISATAIIAGSCPPHGVAHRPEPALVEGYIFAHSFDNGSLRPGGVVESPGLGLSVAGIPVTGLPALPGPNTSVDLGALGITGASLILNEQVTGGDGISSLSFSNNGLHLTLNVVGVISANVIIAHADVAMACQ